MTAGFADEPALDDEPAWCAPARDRIDETNQAITAERQRIAGLAAIIADWAELLPMRHVPAGVGHALAQLYALTAPPPGKDPA